MDNKDLIRELQLLKGIRPNPGLARQQKRAIMSEIPYSPVPFYTGGVVIVLALALGLSSVVTDINSTPEIVVKELEVTSENDTIVVIENTVRQASQQALQIEKDLEKIESQILVAGSEVSLDGLDPLTRLYSQLDQIKLTREVLAEIEQDIRNGDYVIAQNKLDNFLKNGIMDGSSLLRDKGDTLENDTTEE